MGVAPSPATFLDLAMPPKEPGMPEALERARVVIAGPRVGQCGPPPISGGPGLTPLSECP